MPYEVRSAFHQHLVKEGLISQDDGKFYDVIFEARQRGDYIELVSFKKEKVEDWKHKHHNDAFWEVISRRFKNYQDLEKDLIIYWFKLIEQK